MNATLFEMVKGFAPLLQTQIPKISEYLKTLILDAEICKNQPPETNAGLWISLDSKGNLVFVSGYLDKKATFKPQTYADAEGKTKAYIKSQKAIEELLIKALLKL
jgi:leucyl-tRNA synthetase